MIEVKAERSSSMERIECICNTEYARKNLFALKLSYPVCLVTFLLILFCMRDVLCFREFLMICGIYFMLLIPCIIMHIYYSRGFPNILLILTDDSLSYSNVRGKSKSYRLEELKKVKMISKNRYRYGYCFYFVDKKVMIYDGDNLSGLLIRLQKLGKYEKG